MARFIYYITENKYVAVHFQSYLRKKFPVIYRRRIHCTKPKTKNKKKIKMQNNSFFNSKILKKIRQYCGLLKQNL